MLDTKMEEMEKIKENEGMEDTDSKASKDTRANPKNADSLCEVIDFETGSCIEILKDLAKSKSLSLFEEVILERIKRDPSPENVKLCIEEVVESASKHNIN